jgi:hypothetical protein
MVSEEQIESLGYDRPALGASLTVGCVLTDALGAALSQENERLIERALPSRGRQEILVMATVLFWFDSDQLTTTGEVALREALPFIRERAEKGV